VSDSTSRDPSVHGVGPHGVELGYAAALGELEAILAFLDRPDVDVDDLAEKVQRAAVLIRSCRERIGVARLHIEQVMTELDA
jgi:exodeoxyribonuclease VII small subunit